MSIVCPRPAPPAWPSLPLPLRVPPDLLASTGARIELEDLVAASPPAKRVFQLLFAPDAPVSARAMARALGVHPSTLNSRFFRAKLPSAKRYIAWARLIRVALALENPVRSGCGVAMQLRFSSGQHLVRHLREQLGMGIPAFRARYTGAQFAQRFRDELVVPYRVPLERLSLAPRATIGRPTAAARRAPSTLAA